MERFKTVTHKGKAIVSCDFSNMTLKDKEELKELINQAKAFLVKQPPGSVLMLTNVTKMNFDSEVVNLFMEYTVHNKPYIKASAVVGIAGLLTIGLTSVMRNALREIHSFDSEAQALDWLVEQ